MWTEIIGGLDKDGYRKVILCDHGVRRYARVHVLVLEVFIGPAPAGMCGAHNNGIRTDNRLSNLRWATQKNNCADKLKHGTAQRGSQHGNAVLTEEQVIAMRHSHAQGTATIKDLAAQYGVSPSTIGNILSRRQWRHC